LSAMLGAASSQLLSAKRLANFPVRVRKGLAKGARWTMLPFSANWREGSGEVNVERAVGHLLTVRGIVFWDFGAHFGIHSIGLALQVGPHGRVIAFEPDPVAFEKLNRHVRMNKLTNIRLYDAAVSSKTGDANLYFPQAPGSSRSHMQNDEHDDYATPKITVKTVSADDLVESGAIRLPNLIKIDVQGHGARAIAGAMKSIATSRPIIVFRNHSDGELSGTRRLLEPLGYVPEALNGDRIEWTTSSECLLLPPPR
jgi:FkbM family methyltransferase